MLCRILSIVFVLCKNPLISAIFQEEDLISSLLPFLTTPNQRMKGKHKQTKTKTKTKTKTNKHNQTNINKTKQKQVFYYQSFIQ